MYKSSLSLFSVSLLTLSSLAQAEQAAEELSPITVTATRTAQGTKLASTTLITRKDIERLQVNSIEDALRGIAGVNIANNGGLGKSTSIFLRGTESDHVLVLIDGVRVGSATTGSAAFQHIPISQIESIEVVRGAKSSLYGSEALGGIIHIRTRNGADNAFQPSLSVSIGSHDRYRYSGNVAGQIEDSWYNFSLSREQSHGFDSCSPNATSFGCFTNEPDADGYHNNAGSLRLGHNFNDRVLVEAYGLYAAGDTEFDGNFQNEAEFVQQMVGGQVKIRATDFWDFTFKAGESRDRGKNKHDGVFSSYFDTSRFSLTAQNDFQIAENHLFTLGYDYLIDEVESSTEYGESERYNHAFFGQYQGEFYGHQLVLGFREDYNQQFGKHDTWNAAWGYTFDNNITVSASYATAYKAPTFNELYFPNFGNADLNPERSRSYEIAISGEHDWGRWSVNHYHTYISDLIAFDSSIFAPNNISNARIRGVEAIAATQVFGFDIQANLTFLNPENRSTGANSGKLLARRAEQSFRLDVDKRIDDLSVGASFIAEGRRFDNLSNTRRLSGFTTLDLRAEYTLFNQVTAQAKINNILDKQYQTAAGYNADGLNLFFTLTYTPDI
ncbi:MAG: TonB-dependent vitamin B12 receptor [Methylococcaceae bacterium]|nr:TonB-dependent vitamin B12 receptor [Methylococcaceae bacterium]